MRALISVYDKDGIADFARGLSELGFELVSSGGTAAALEEGAEGDAGGGAHDSRRCWTGA